MPTSKKFNIEGKMTNWQKNVGKSVAFSALDVLQELAPNIFATSENAITAAQDLTNKMREMKPALRTPMKYLETNVPAAAYAKIAWSNAKKDFKSGNWNNEERLQKLAAADNAEAMGLDGDDDNLFSLDDEDDSVMEFDDKDTFDDGLDVSDDVKKGVKPVVDSLKPGLKNIAKSGRHTAIATENIAIGQSKQSKLIADGFYNSMEFAKYLAITQANLNKQYQDNTINGFKTINENLGKIIAFNDENVGKFTMGALQYFTDQLDVTRKILESVNRIADKTAPIAEEKEAEEKSQYERLFTGRGVMRFSNYPGIVKENFLRTVEDDAILGPIWQALFDTDALKALSAKPLEFLSRTIVTEFLPTMIKESIKNLDSIVGSFFPALLAKIGNYKAGDNPLKELFGNIFGLRIDARTNANIAKYEKGAVPFDGITHTTINTVIPEYLAGILAAVSGKEQLVYDYENATFTTKHSMMKRLEDEQLEAKISGYSKLIDEMIQMRDAAFEFKNEEDKINSTRAIKRAFATATEEQLLMDWQNIDPERLGLYGSDAEMFKLLFRLANKRNKMSFGKGMFESNANMDKYYKSLMEDDEYKAKRMAYMNTFNNIYANSHIKERSTVSDSIYTTKENGNIISSDSEYIKSQSEILLDIKEILLEGILVYPRAGDITPVSTTNTTGNNITSRLEEFRKQKKLYGEHKLRFEEEVMKYKNKDSDELKDAAKKGKQIIPEGGNIRAAEAAILSAKAENKILDSDAKRRKELENRNKMGGFYDRLDRWINESTFGEKITDIRKSIDKFFRTPSEFIRNSLDKISDTLFAIIYGDEDKKSFVDLAKEKIQETFEKFNTWLRKKWNAGTNYIFGEGGLTESKIYKWFKEKSSNLFDYLFGKKTSSGSREGGAFSETFNVFSDLFLNVRHELFGTSYKDSKGKEHSENKSSVFHEIKGGISTALGEMRKYLFGEPKKNADGSNKSFLDEMTDSLSAGFTNWKNFFFGTKLSESDGKKEFTQISEDFKKHLPRALAVGIVGAGIGLFTNFGLLGTLFLPGGPIGGAIVGIATGFLSQSEKFKSFLFGPLGVDGFRQGGIIPKSIQTWVYKHKTALLGGATFGALKGLLSSLGVFNLFGPVGYMASFLLPGGPIFGALAGAAVGIGVKSKVFQDFLYGKIGTDGKRLGGILQTQFSSSIKKYLPNMAFGALSFGAASAVIGQFGLLGAMLTPGGVLGAAILGAATGIAISSEKFRNFLFGKEDEKTGLKEAGLFNKLSNVFSISIVEPFKIKMSEISDSISHWFEKEIGNRFSASLSILNTQFKLMAKDIKALFARGWDFLTNTIDNIFEKAVGIPLGKFLEEKVLKPMRSFMDKLINGIGKIFGSILSSPFKAMAFMTSSMLANQESRGIKENRAERSAALKSGISDTGSLLSSKIKDFFGFATPEESEKAKSMSLLEASKSLLAISKSNVMQYTDSVKSEDKKKYIDGDEIRKKIAELDAETEAKYEERRKQREIQKESLRMRREIATTNNFDTVIRDSEGKPIADLSKLYDMKTPLNEIDLHTVEQTGVLTRILDGIKSLFQSSEKSNLMAAAMAYHETGEPEFLEFGTKDSSAVAEKDIPSKLKDTKISEDIKDKEKNDNIIAEETAENIEESKKVEAKEDKNEVKKPSLISLLNGKLKVTEENILQLIDSIPENASKEVKDFYNKSIEYLMNRYIKTSESSTQNIAESNEKEIITKESKKSSKKSETPMEAIVNIGETVKSLEEKIIVQEQKKTEPIRVEASASREEREFDARNKVSGGYDPSIKYLRIIASSVDGQLNGVGSNVYKSRKLLEALTGISSDDITGSNNKDRVTLLGRARRFITMMIFHPIEFIGSIIMKPFQVIASIGEKIWKTAWNIVDSVGSAITKTANAIVDVGKKAVEIVVAVPKMALEVIGGVAEVTKETLIAGVRILSEGITGALSATFKIVTGAAKGVGSVISGVGKAIGKTFEGIGELSKGLFKTLGTALSGAVDIVGTLSKSVISVSGAIAEGATKIFSSAVGGITNIAVKLVGGITDLITTAASSIFSIAASPFKFIGNLAKGLILRSSHVIVDGGRLDTVRNVERVEKILVLNKVGQYEDKNFLSSMADTFRSITGVTSAKSATEDILPEPKKEDILESVAEEQKAEPKKESVAEVKKEEKKEVISEPKKKEVKREEPGKPATTNVTADMVRSGVVTGGQVQRTAATSKAIAEANEEKDLMKNNELKQTSLLERIYHSANERNTLFNKLLKFLGGAALLLWGFLKGIVNKLSLAALGSIIGKAIEKGLKNFKSVLPESFTKASGGIFSNLREGMAKAAARIATIPKQIAETVGERFKLIFDTVKKKLGIETVEETAKTAGKNTSKVVASEIAEGGIKSVKSLSEFKPAGLLTEGTSKIVASEIAEGGIKAGTNLPALVENTTKIVAPAEKVVTIEAGKLVITGEQAIVQQIPGWLEKLKSAIYNIEDFICRNTGKNVKFADSLWARISKIATPAVLKANAGKISAAVARSGLVGTIGSLPILNGIIIGYNVGTGLITDAAHMFRIREEQVTITMRLCAAIVKTVIGFPQPQWAIFTAVLMIICALMGVDMRSWLAQELYKILVDSKSAREFEMAQAQFEQDAIEAGFTKTDIFGNTVADVDAYNNKVNETFAGGIIRNAKEKYNQFKEYMAPKVESVKTTISEKFDNIKSFIDNIPEKFDNLKTSIASTYSTTKEDVFDFINNIPDNFANFKDYISNSFSSAKDYISESISNTQSPKNYFLGYTDESGNYVPGFFTNTAAFITSGFTEMTASLLNITPKELEDGMNTHGPAMFITSKILGYDVEKLKQNKRIKYIRQTWMNLFGGIDEETGEYHKNIIEQFETGIDSFMKNFKMPSVDEMFFGTPENPKAFGIFYYPITKKFEELSDFIGKRIDIIKDEWEKCEFNFDWLLFGPDGRPTIIKDAIDTVTLGIDFIGKKFDIFKDKWEKWEFNFDWLLFGPDGRPTIIKNAIDTIFDPLIKGAKNIGNSIYDSFAKIPDMISNAIDGFTTYLSDQFRITWGKFVGWLLGDDDYNKDVKQLMSKYEKIEEAKTSAMEKVIKPAEYKFRGSGRITMDSYKQYGYEYNEDNSCAPTLASNLFNINPKDAADYAIAGGYKTPSGTTEDYFPAIANAVGANTEKIDSIGELINASMQGKRIAVGGIGNNYTQSGHYSEAIPLEDGVYLEDTRGPKYDKIVDYDTFSRETKTAYAFSGMGDGDISTTKLDVNAGNIIGQLKTIFVDWINSGGVFGLIKDGIETGFNNLKEFLFGNIPSGVYLLREAAESATNWVFGKTESSGIRSGGVFQSLYDYLSNKINELRNWIIGKIPNGSIVIDTVTKVIPDKITEFGENLVKSLSDTWNEFKKKVFNVSNLNIKDLFVSGLKMVANKLSGKGEDTNKLFSGFGKFKPRSFSGSGNRMSIDAQGRSDCTAFSTRALYRAYTGKDIADITTGNWYNFLHNDLGVNEIGFSQDQREEFEKVLTDHFNTKPENPILLYLTGGQDKSHLINVGSGNHAVVIGRKLSNGQFEIYDPNGASVYTADLHQIFDPSAIGSAAQNTASYESNMLLIPKGDPSDKITIWASNNESASSGSDTSYSTNKPSDSYSDINVIRGTTPENNSIDWDKRGINGLLTAFSEGFTSQLSGSGEIDQKKWDAYHKLQIKEGSPIPKKKFRGKGIEEIQTEPGDPEAPANLPVFKQWDPRWGNNDYGGNSFTQSACGPTSMAMLSTWATGNTIMPPDAAKYAVDNGFRKSGEGTTWDYFNNYASALGYNIYNTSDNNEMIKNVDSGIPVISAQGPGKFTKKGHFILVVGKRKDGSYIVYDPNNYYATDKFNKDDITTTSAMNFIPSGEEVGKKSISNASSSSTSTNKSSGGNEPDTIVGLFNKTLHEYGVAMQMGIAGQKYTDENWKSANISNSSNFTSNSTASSQPSGEIVSGSNDMSEEDIWKWFRSKGYSPEVTAGIMGRLKGENNLSSKYTKFQNSGGYEVGGFGLFQWTYGNGTGYNYPDPMGSDKETVYNLFPDSRLVKYMKWVDQNDPGNYESSINELNYMYNEDLKDPWVSAGASNTRNPSNYPRPISSISTWYPEGYNVIKDPKIAADKWGASYEVGVYDSKVDNYADEILGKFSGLSGNGKFSGNGIKSFLLKHSIGAFTDTDQAEELYHKLDDYPRIQRVLDALDNFSDPISILKFMYNNAAQMDSDLKSGKVTAEQLRERFAYKEEITNYDDLFSANGKFDFNWKPFLGSLLKGLFINRFKKKNKPNIVKKDNKPETKHSFNRDSLGNIIDFNIPEYNKITEDDSIAVKKSKMEAQAKQYWDEYYDKQKDTVIVKEQPSEIIVENKKQNKSFIEKLLSTYFRRKSSKDNKPSYKEVFNGDGIIDNLIKNQNIEYEKPDFIKNIERQEDITKESDLSNENMIEVLKEIQTKSEENSNRDIFNKIADLLQLVVNNTGRINTGIQDLNTSQNNITIEKIYNRSNNTYPTSLKPQPHRPSQRFDNNRMNPELDREITSLEDSEDYRLNLRIARGGEFKVRSAG